MKHHVKKNALLLYIVGIMLVQLACSPAPSKAYLPTPGGKLPPTEQAQGYTVTAEVLNVRQFPEAGAAVVGTLEGGAVVECLQTVAGVYGGQWCNVGAGWVDMAWLAIP